MTTCGEPSEYKTHNESLMRDLLTRDVELQDTMGKLCDFMTHKEGQRCAFNPFTEIKEWSGPNYNYQTDASGHRIGRSPPDRERVKKDLRKIDFKKRGTSPYSIGTWIGGKLWTFAHGGLLACETLKDIQKGTQSPRQLRPMEPKEMTSEDVQKALEDIVSL